MGVLLAVIFCQGLDDDVPGRADDKDASLVIHEELDGFQHFDDAGFGAAVQIVDENHHSAACVVRFFTWGDFGAPIGIGPDQIVEKSAEGVEAKVHLLDGGSVTVDSDLAMATPLNGFYPVNRSKRLSIMLKWALSVQRNSMRLSGALWRVRTPRCPGNRISKRPIVCKLSR